MNREAEHEPVTVDWLIDTICPNKGNSPLMNYNKKRLRELIDRLVIEGQQGRISTPSEPKQPDTSKSLTHAWRPPVVVPFEAKHVQVFPHDILPKGVFTQNLMRKYDGDGVKSLDYSIEYEYRPAEGNDLDDDYKPASIMLHLRAKVTDLVTTSPEASTDSSNPPEYLLSQSSQQGADRADSSEVSDEK